MDNKKQDKKQAKTQPLANLPIVTLSEKDMSSVNGGNYGTWTGWLTSIDVRNSNQLKQERFNHGHKEARQETNQNTASS